MVTTGNTYIAAYYVIHGGVLESVREKRVVNKKDNKAGVYWKWLFTLSGVHQKHIDNVNNRTAQVKLDELAEARTKLKIKAKKLLEIDEAEKSWKFKEKRLKIKK